MRNSGVGSIVIDPNASETIDGAATLSLSPGQAVELICDGGAWKSTARNTIANPIGLADIHAAALSLN